jgi:glutamyl-tRNA reductase
MSVLVVGLSHKSAPVGTLERAALAEEALGKLLHDLAGAEDVAGCFVVSTCNRVEVYAEVGKFHGGVAAISELLARHAGMPLAELTPHLYVHYEGRAIQHLLSVACGLDSMVTGESQILGQVRQALSLAREQETLGPALSGAGSLALRAGKRAHSETGIDRAGANLVSIGLAASAQQLRRAAAATSSSGSARQPRRAAAAGQPAGAGQSSAGPLQLSPDALAGLSVLIVGAGSMSSLAVATASRMGAASLVVANRSAERARRLAATVSARAADLAQLEDEIALADLVVCCTGAPGHVITAGAVASARQARTPARPLVLLDLALPRDVDPAVRELDGVSVLDLEEVGQAGGPGAGQGHEEDVAAIRRIVADELAAHLSADRAAKVTPTVVALRAKAAGVVESELARLTGRVPGLDTRARREIAQSMRRIADKLLHAPTVRVKELAGSPGGDSYEAVLRVLFDLDPEAVQAVTRADAVAPGWPEQEAPR